MIPISYEVLFFLLGLWALLGLVIALLFGRFVRVFWRRKSRTPVDLLVGAFGSISGALLSSSMNMREPVGNESRSPWSVEQQYMADHQTTTAVITTLVLLLVCNLVLARPLAEGEQEPFAE